MHQIKDLGKWLHQTYIDSLSLIMLGLDHAKAAREVKRSAIGEFYGQGRGESVDFKGFGRFLNFGKLKQVNFPKTGFGLGGG